MSKNKVEELLEEGYILSEDGQSLVKTDALNYRCVGVYHIGKYPQVFSGCHIKNGRYWNIRYRSVTLKIPDPLSFLKFRFGGLFKEVKYAVKSYFTARSSFLQMEEKYYDGDEWVWEYSEPGSNDPYYVCARFANGRHIPLPILDDWYDENRLQKWAISLAGGAPEAKSAAELYVEEK
ncbi:MAG: hypothetical protein GF334_00230 [Candidatus Altiarchaeales archaeon]|nr:hypothetical protein [Candidatus Altiarchaeales archaeon]